MKLQNRYVLAWLVGLFSSSVALGCSSEDGAAAGEDGTGIRQPDSEEVNEGAVDPPAETQVDPTAGAELPAPPGVNPPATAPGAMAGTGGGDEAEEGAGGDALEGTCPDGFTPSSGDNRGFVSDGVERRFHVMLPEDTSTPRPVFLALTGTEQAELDFASQSALDSLPERGWIVVIPWRRCSTESRNCNGVPSQIGGTRDGRTWEPWYERSSRPSDDEGPDVRFAESAVRCVATGWQVDQDRIYFGGISAGGTFSNRLLTFGSEFFAGGVPASGNWDAQVRPQTPREMDSSIAIIVWGGETDIWPLNDPIVAYDDDTRNAAAFFDAQPNVVTVACTGPHGHVWPANGNYRPPFSSVPFRIGPEFTHWAADTLLSHPKGSDPADFELMPPPDGMNCVVGEYTDH